MTESEIAELCRRIYRKHQRALDLILEHRPDQQAAVRDVLERLVQERPGLALDHCSKSYIRFAPVAWDVPRLKTGKGWTRSERVLLFEFANAPDRLKLKLLIGPGPDDVRQGLFDVAQRHKAVFRTAFKALNQKWNTIYDKSFLAANDYDEASDEQLGAEIRKHWDKFVENDLPAISGVLSEE